MRLIFLFVALLYAHTLSGATYYVSTTGNNSTGDGSIGNPWLTIRKGLTMMSTGDTLNLRGGTYTSEAFKVSEFVTGTTVQSYPSETAIYKDSTDHLNMVHIGNGKSNIVVNGIVFDGTSQSSSVFKIDGGSQSITLTNCTFQACHDGHGLIVSSLSDDTEVGNLLVTHCRFLTNGWAAINDGSGPYHQIYIQNSSNRVEYCYIEGINNPQGGTYGIHDFSHSWGNIYRHNYVTNCNSGIGIVGTQQRDSQVYNNVIVGSLGYGVTVRTATNILVANNSAYNGLGGIAFETVTNSICENNIAVGSTGNNPGGVYIFNGCSGMTVRNNLAYGSTVSGSPTWDYREASSSGTTLSGNKFGKISPDATVFTYDAKFSDAANGVLFVLAGSDAINAGVSQSLFASDYLGVSRPQGAAWDIGAYEYVAPSSPGTTTGKKPRQGRGFRWGW